MEKREEGSEFNSLSRENIVSKFDELLKEKELQELIPAVEEIEAAYQECSQLRKEEELQKFLDEGGYEADFVLHKDKTDGKFTELYNIFKDRKDKFFDEKKSRERDNLSAKRQVIEELKTLIEKGDSVGKAFQQFRALRDKWQNIGDVPQKEEEKLESDYRYQRERFYHIIQITQGLRDLDLQKHLEEKTMLLQKMEDLLQERTVRKVELLIRKYHNDWYDIGPVPVTQKDEIVRRFNEITEKVYAKNREHYDSLKLKYQENSQAKDALCAQVEGLNSEENRYHSEWEKKTKEILRIQEEWKKIGRATKEESLPVWERFRKACNEFFEKKRSFYETLKKDYDTNKQTKIKICEQVESVQNSTEWDKTARLIIGLQRQWEKIGPSGLQRVETALWNRFRSTCNAFFEAKKKHFESLEGERRKNLSGREAIIKKLIDLAPSVTSADALPAIRVIGKEWEEAGDIPDNLREDIFQRYTQALDACYEKMGMDAQDKELLKYSSKIERLKNSYDGERLLEDEKRFIRGKIRSIEDEIAKTENNMGFFTKSSKVDVLLQGVLKNVEQSKAQLVFFKKKLEMLEKGFPKNVQMR